MTLSAGWDVVAVIAAIVVGSGLIRLADHVLLSKGDDCHLEGER
jgi:hypothetical protein